MNRYAIGLAAWVLAAAACGDAQDATVVRVDYVTVVVDAEGAETPWAEGVHYIADDGRYRHDEAVIGRSPTSSYRLPAEDVNVTLNHSLLEAVGSGLVPPMEVAAPVGRGSQASVFNPQTLPDIGERTLGPLQLRGVGNAEDGTEFWLLVHPMTLTDLRAYPPIPIEATMSMGVGQRLVTRATSARRVPLEPDTFVVPDPTR